MKDLVEFIAKTLVDSPDEVDVQQIEEGDFVVLELRVASEDMGKVIGKQGRVVTALRALAKVAAARQNKRATVKII